MKQQKESDTDKTQADYFFLNCIKLPSVALLNTNMMSNINLKYMYYYMWLCIYVFVY